MTYTEKFLAMLFVRYTAGPLDLVKWFSLISMSEATTTIIALTESSIRFDWGYVIW